MRTSPLARARSPRSESHAATVDGAEGVTGGLATPGLFAALGVRPQLGRLIEPSDLLGRESSVVLLTDAFWRARCGAGTDVIGHVIYLDGAAVTIVGMLPARCFGAKR